MFKERRKIKIALIIGAGPAGLSAAYNLLKEAEDIKPVIVEELDCAGGISRTVFWGGNATDLGPHRMFSKNNDVLNMWEMLLPLQGKPPIDDKILKRKISLSPIGPDPDKTDRVMLKRKRLSRIYYLRKFFDYPISMNASTFMNMGMCRLFKAGMSYLKSRVIKRKEDSLEDFMINRFGRVLYEMFFEKYTQKVWGLHPSNISKEWGEQRIKGLSLSKAILNALYAPFKFKSRHTETSLIDEYYYPKFGCSQLWNVMVDEILKMGGEIRYNSKVTNFEYVNSVLKAAVLDNGEHIEADYFISTMPVKDLIAGLKNVPEDIAYIADNLCYRDYNLVSLYCSKIDLKNNTKIPTFNNTAPDSWIYIQENDITAGRIHIMNNFSPYVVKDFEHKVLINLEYFCNNGDELWEKTDEEMIDFGISELEKLNIIAKKDVLKSKRIKVSKAYPAYFGVYKDFDKLQAYLDSIENLYCIGRNGQHKYNNMDHSVLSGIVVAKVIKNNLDKEILWDVNTEKEYQEIKKQTKSFNTSSVNFS